jgi:hypothetical protein
MPAHIRQRLQQIRLRGYLHDRLELLLYLFGLGFQDALQ